MAFARLLAVLAAGLLVVDREFGDGRLLDALGHQAVQMVHLLDDAVARIADRISDHR